MLKFGVIVRCLDRYQNITINFNILSMSLCHAIRMELNKSKTNFMHMV